MRAQSDCACVASGAARLSGDRGDLGVGRGDVALAPGRVLHRIDRPDDRAVPVDVRGGRRSPGAGSVGVVALLDCRCLRVRGLVQAGEDRRLPAPTRTARRVAVGLVGQQSLHRSQCGSVEPFGRLWRLGEAHRDRKVVGGGASPLAPTKPPFAGGAPDRLTGRSRMSGPAACPGGCAPAAPGRASGGASRERVHRGAQEPAR